MYNHDVYTYSLAIGPDALAVGAFGKHVAIVVKYRIASVRGVLESMPEAATAKIFQQIIDYDRAVVSHFYLSVSRRL